MHKNANVIIVISLVAYLMAMYQPYGLALCITVWKSNCERQTVKNAE